MVYDEPAFLHVIIHTTGVNRVTHRMWKFYETDPTLSLSLKNAIMEKQKMGMCLN